LQTILSFSRTLTWFRPVVAISSCADEDVAKITYKMSVKNNHLAVVKSENEWIARG